MADNAVTLNMIPFSGETTRQTGFTHAAVINYTDINTTGGQGDTVTVSVGTTPDVYVIDRAVLVVETAFAYATGSATLTIQAGINGNTDALCEAANAKTAGCKSGQVALTDSSTGTASNTLAALANLSTTDTYTDAAVNAKLAIIKNALASLAAKLNNGMLTRAPIITGTSANTLQVVLTCQNTTGGEPDNISAGKAVLYLRILDLSNSY